MRRDLTLSRRLRAIAVGALVWGAAWSVIGFAAYAVLHLVGAASSPFRMHGAVLLAARCAFWGGALGGLFSGAISLVYRGRTLRGISWWRCGLLGGVLAGVLLPALLQLLNLLSGDGFVPMALVLDDAVMAAVFGTLVAGGSMRLAQRVSRLVGSADDAKVIGR